MTIVPPVVADEHASRLQEIKSRLLQGRDRARDLHRQSRDPAAVGALLAGSYDRAIEQAYQLALATTPAERRAVIVQELNLVAVGGFGRGDLAPYSDVDLLFLSRRSDSPVVSAFVSQMVRDLWDAGMELAHSVRTVAGCVAAGRADLTICTALVEARPLIGPAGAFAELQRRACRLVSSLPVARFVSEILSARAEEHQDYHTQTVFLLEPNVKKSVGGLRDYHTLRWLAQARYGVRDIELLQAGGMLSETDARAVLQARDTLQHIRNEMHFEAGSAQDVLTREEQVRLAAWLGFGDDGRLLGVERFMQHYYRHTTGLNDVLTRLIERVNRPGAARRLLDRLSTVRTDQHFLFNRRTIAIAPDSTDAVLSSAERCLHLLDCARTYEVRVDHETMELLMGVSGDINVTRDCRRRFLRMLANPVGLGQLLRDLSRSGLLGRVVPPFEHARCLIQFNVHHKYTVDEHSLRSLEAAVDRMEDPGPIGQAYRSIHRKDLLHLALLLHDLGKGLGDDHCEVGRRLAEQTAEGFGLSEHERLLLVQLVGEHLLMAQTAFRRDLSDEATVVQFARAVATPEMLRMLYVMTAADTQAVSPENWTAWKDSLLSELYFRTAEELTGEAPVGDEQTRARAIRAELTRDLAKAFDSDWLDMQLGMMPVSYLENRPVEGIRRDLEVLQGLVDQPVRVDSRYLPDTGLVEYTVFTRDDMVAGLFSKIAGTLAAAGFQIVSARIITRCDNVVIDTFRGQDLTFTGEPPRPRRDEVAEQIVQVLLGKRDVEQMLARRREWPPFGVGLPSNRSIPELPPQVEIDNDSSDRFTIVEVFAPDRLGLLYTITRTLFELELPVWSAKISTHVDQVVDTFYVTTRQGGKVADEEQLAVIRDRLLNVLRSQQ